MPVHEFIHEASGERISIFVPIKAAVEEHQKQIVDGREYKRVYDEPPLIGKDMHHNDGTFNDFRKATDGKNVRMGDLYDISKEMSEKRAHQNGGLDPVKERMYKDYERKFKKKHPEVSKREQRKKIREKFGVRIED